MTAKIHSASLVILLVCTVVVGVSAKRAAPEETGISVSQWQALASELSLLSGSIQAVQLLRSDGFWVDRVAFLTESRDSGWQIFVFHLENTDRFSLEWKSGKLEDSFAVSSARQFETRNVAGSEQVLEFSGCAAHNCPDVFSVMLYVPSRKTAFTATSILGKVTYSSGLESPANRVYKGALDRSLQEHTN